MKFKGFTRIPIVSAALVVMIALLVPALAERGYPIKDAGELRVFHPMPTGSVGIKSHADNPMFQAFEKNTGVKIKWIEPTMGLDAEQFNLMLAARDLPDVFELPSKLGNWTTVPGGAEKFYKDKVILKLNDLIDKYAPDFKAVLRKNPQIRKELMADDGSIYYIPLMRADPALRIYSGPIFRQDWLDKLGLQVPRTVDEFYNVLKAFKTKDPNGNGQADEIPMSATKQAVIYEFCKMIWPWGVNFGQWQNNGMMQVRGKVNYSPIMPEFKDALAFCNKLYKEGLLDSDFAVQDRNAFNAKVMADKVGCFYGLAGSGITFFTTNMKGKEPKSFKLVGAPYPVVKKTDKKGFNFSNEVVTICSGGFAISATCKRPDVAMKWLNYGFTKEGHMLVNFGVEGLSYKMVDGYPKYTELITNNPQGLAMGNAIGNNAQTSWASVNDIRYFEQYQQLTPDPWAAIQVWAASTDPSRILPPLTLSPEESQRTASKFNEITTYAMEMYYKFIMGTEPLDNFDKYVAQIKKMGIDEVLAVYQGVLTRFNKRK